MKRFMVTISLLFVWVIILPQVYAKTYPASMWLAPTHIITVNGYTNWAIAVKKATNGEIDFEVYVGGSLLPAKETLKGVADGVAVVGMIAAAYTPTLMPLDNIINDLAFTNENAMAAAFAVTELKFTHPNFHAEYANNGLVFGGGYSTPLYHFLCTSEIKSKDDVAGKKIRTVGMAFVRFIKEAGGVPVSVPFTEIYSGMERGSLDCTMADSTALSSGAKLWEVTKSINTLPLGTQLSGATWIYNKDFWKGLSAKHRRLLLDESAVAFVRLQLDYDRQVASAEKGSMDRGITFIEPDESLKSLKKDFSEIFIKTLPKVSMEDRKVTDPSDIIQKYLKLVNKYVEILSKVDTMDEAALVDIAKREIFNKVDEKSYGLD
jgi:TRAP-type C4-dicarboxylate transport system substrate-binding protein